MQSKSEPSKKEPCKKEVEYQISVCVKDTNQENGPGHVSALLIKKKGNSTTISHTSFFPGPFGSVINGLTLGSVPVKGQLAPDHVQDIQEADHVLVASVSKEQYKSAKKGQQEFHQQVETGQRAYSVFGKSNPIAKGLNRLANGCKGAQLITEKHLKTSGSLAPEDMCGVPVFDDDHPKFEKVRLDNCSSSVSLVVKKGGFVDFKNPKIPSFFTSELEKNGFQKVDKVDFAKKLEIKL
ncbi:MULTISPECIES: hypothetical protein [Legionella]|uniref:Uncharacterized protein n=1 Tax=Legionella resiliens TaxID=2905958 RepID=A0ABS8X8A7_9GAMM|nr:MULTISPECIES: hypothetical protein [unclassified Legionella]MCE0723767.1 hypothetical protein [Legionella sp. 9fVS26]MCE3532919.1 hypothetical protein [Legionella sp. 8cVS16]QLZ69107.1 hypothetical protein FOLKNPGA_01889 [Legionella sp. PC1000]